MNKLISYLRIGLLWGICLFPFLSFAQIDSTRIEEGSEISPELEDLIINTETEEQVDFTFLTDYLQDLRRNPLDLNRANRDELSNLPGMDELLALNLLAHISRFGPLSSLYELQAVPGFSPEVFDQIKPFVTVLTGREQDIRPKELHPAGPTLKEVLQGMRGDFMQRVAFLGEAQRGYQPLDTTFSFRTDAFGDTMGVDTSVSSRYQGPAYQSYSRLRLRYANNFSLALVGEKDRGEAWRWDPENQYYGFDFLAGHIAIQNYGRLKSLVIGDYTMQFGQGLVLSRGLGFGKGQAVIRATKMPARGIRPYASVNENQYLRGAAATYAFGKLYLTAFYSRNRYDASVQERDTLTEEAEIVGALQLGGLHRTETELANRRAIRETAFGGRVAYERKRLKLGVTHYWQQFGASLDRSLNAFNQYDFRGDRNFLSSFDFDWVVQNFNLFGEVARSRSGGVAATLGMMAALSPTVDMSLVARSFDRDFHSFKGYAFAERPTAISNEQGIYLGLRIQPNYTWTISGYFDQYYYGWNTFRASYPSRGYEYLLQVDYRKSRNTLFYVRFRSDNKQENGATDDTGLAYLVSNQRLQLRFHFQTSLQRKVNLRTRLEFSRFEQDRQEPVFGMLLYQDIRWKPGFKWSLTARYAIFDAPEFDARIYAYENDVLGFFSIPAYYRTGSRYYLIFNCKLGRRLEFWARLAQSRFAHLREVGTGQEAIQGDRRTEVKLQLRLKL
jgi:hypothetical protein